VSSSVRESRLPNGLRIVTEELPHARSAAAGLYVLRGSRDESWEQAGLSHLLEHLLFKGTAARPGRPEGRSLRAIAEEIDRLGGELDAWTQVESTGFELEVLPESLDRALDLLGDLVGRPELDQRELEREREVVREEIRGVEDDPDDLLEELWAAWSFPEHPLGRPILGTEAQLDARDAAGLRRFWQDRHRGGCLLACAAGRVEHEAVVARLAEGLGHLPAGAPARGPAAPVQRRGVFVKRKEHLEQAHLVFSMPGLPEADPRAPVLELLAVLLGDGNASRLWQRVREEEGLAYDIGVSTSDYRDTGRFVVEASSAAERVRPILRLVHEELADLAAHGPREEELERVREHVRTGLVLSWEGAGAHLDALAGDLVVHGRAVPLEEHLQHLAAVSREQVHALAGELFAAEARGLVVLGPGDLPELSEGDLQPGG
jgi:predicted Zn-dependent peptidase